MADLSDEQKQRLQLAMAKMLDPQIQQEVYARLGAGQQAEALELLGLNVEDYTAFQDYVKPFKPRIATPSDAQKERLTLAFRRLLEPQELATFLPQWQHDPAAALPLVGLTRGDFFAFRSYINSFESSVALGFWDSADCGPDMKVDRRILS